jgi:uncharacterized membrane protein
MTRERLHTTKTGRLESFSDGVFAIAITLLILEVKVPELGKEANNARLLSALVALWPSYLALVTSFLSILIMWINHHSILDAVARCDRQFMSLNGLLLLLVSAVPFPTAVVAQYLTAPAEGIAVAVYAGMFFVINIVFVLLWRSATRPHIVKEDVPLERIALVSRRLFVGLPGYLLAAFVSLLNPYVGIGICLALWGVYWAFMAYEVPEERRGLRLFQK